MNKILSIIVLLTAYTFSFAQQSSELVGTWEATMVQRNNCTVEDNNGADEFSCPDLCLLMTVNADGSSTNTYTDPSGSSRTMTATYQVIGSEVTWYIDDMPNESFTYIITGDQLTFTTLEEDSGCEVITTFLRK